MTASTASDFAIAALRKWSGPELADPQATNRLRRSFGLTPAEASRLIAAEVAAR